ncbi:hypothetical protein WMY93_033037 [Mugilogobius chulae]|uniref:Uncharacterized protein n=1 Tax=Mugilogobius chulae TaxID=88201 RepID=A0AAW0MMG2_9GOBI
MSVMSVCLLLFFCIVVRWVQSLSQRVGAAMGRLCRPRFEAWTTEQPQGHLHDVVGSVRVLAGGADLLSLTKGQDYRQCESELWKIMPVSTLCGLVVGTVVVVLGFFCSTKKEGSHVVQTQDELDYMEPSGMYAPSMFRRRGQFDRSVQLATPAPAWWSLEKILSYKRERDIKKREREREREIRREERDIRERDKRERRERHREKRRRERDIRRERERRERDIRQREDIRERERHKKRERHKREKERRERDIRREKEREREREEKRERHKKETIRRGDIRKRAERHQRRERHKKRERDIRREREREIRREKRDHKKRERERDEII